MERVPPPAAPHAPAPPGLRIAVVTTVHPWGDPRIFERDVATCLAWGEEVHVFMSLKEDPPRTGWAGSPGLHLHPLPGASGRGGRLLKSLLAWRAVLRAGPFDLVHFHDPELIPAMALHALLRPRTYHLFDIHEDLPTQIQAKRYLPEGLRRPLARLAEWCLGLSRHLFDGFAPATETIAEAWPAESSRVVHNYPMALYAAKPGRLRTDPHRAIYVGSLSEIRGIRMDLEAARKVRGEVPDFRLDLVGPIQDPSLEAPIQAAVREGWCRHLPWLSPKELALFAAGAGIGLVTLLPEPNYLQSLPTKLFEYMALGVPVLASKFPLWQELLEQAGAGMLVEPTVEAVAAGMLLMASRPLLLRSFATRGRRAYRRRYQWEREARNLAWHLRRAATQGHG